MSRKFNECTEFNLNAGRNAFRCDENFDDWENVDSETITLRNSAIRSFTESVDADFPPAPELPPALNIDLCYPEEAMRRSETSETIVERKPKLSLQELVSGTQKYPMMVPGPGHVDEEQELHASLLHHNDEGSESDVEIDSFKEKQSLDVTPEKISNHPNLYKKSLTLLLVGSLSERNAISESFQEQQKKRDRAFKALRREYSVSILERPRPTTPTSWCTIENYVEGSAEADDEPSPVATKKQKIHVSIPNHNVSQTGRRRRMSMSWLDFYEIMSTQIPSQGRRSMSGSATPIHDSDGDILEENPRYRNVAPPKPVIHRRSSTDWENFMDNDGVKHSERIIF
ncbi:unnamed protein product [Litomosoides sigmodontis]|uniref:Uncharacterized protein n=1 Tax=Litomosoides sigmodontis TaxID=42156 RepID=A0A3P7JL86_LITSI|nr:unnamed protein product [Litomosoides sigmodontis]